jgi:DHA1 family inner membrane transport protein
MQRALFSLFLGTLALGTTEFLIAGVLPSVAADLGVEIATAGLAITGYAIGVAVGGPLLTAVLSRVSARTALLLLLFAFALGQGVCAVAPDFRWLVTARVVVAATHGAFFGIAAVVATRLVPADRAGRAVAVLLAGITVANVLGVPAGTAVGGWLGWRTAFWCVLALGLIGVAAIALWVPSLPPDRKSAGIGLAEQIKGIAGPTVSLTFAVIILSMAGQIALFTYVASYLGAVTGVATALLPVFLLVYGLGSTLGVVVGGRLADWRLMPSLLALLAAQIAVYLAIVWLGGQAPIMLALMLVWGFVAFGFTAPAQARILVAAGAAPALASSLIPTAFNIGIALGASAGAWVLQSGGSDEALPWVGVCASTAAVLVAMASWLIERRAQPGVAAARPQDA